MARVPNRFTNPANSDHYDWHVNHDAEDPSGKTRNISRTANTGGVGLVKQQSDDGPLIKHLSGTTPIRAQIQAFWQWYQLSRDQTIYFTDFDGQGYEVQITSFLPQKIRKEPSQRKDPSAPWHYWKWTMEMEIYRIISGDEAGVSP